jgi:hypothetical protein
MSYPEKGIPRQGRASRWAKKSAPPHDIPTEGVQGANCLGTTPRRQLPTDPARLRAIAEMSGD